MRKLTLVCMMVLGTGVALAQGIEKQATVPGQASQGQTARGVESVAPAAERSFDDALPGFIIGARADEPCPDDSITGQFPSACPAQNTVWYFYSDVNFCSGTLCLRVRCENFPKTGLLDPNDPNDAIGTIRWYGVNVEDPIPNGCSKGTPGTYPFRVRFYADNAGTPNTANPVYTETVTPTMTDTGETVLFTGATQPAIRWQYTAVLTTPQHMTKGWFSICGAGSTTCFSLWEGSGGDGGDNRFFQWFETGGVVPGPAVTDKCDLDYCFGVKRIGACCDDFSSTCTEHTAQVACDAFGGRFLVGENTPCSAFGDPNYPPADPNCPNVVCGDALGACCHNDGTACSLTFARDCVVPPQTICRGDANCDGVVDFADINPFIEALSGGPCCDGTGQNCDANGDGVLNFDDINPFVALLGQPCTVRSGRNVNLWLGACSSCDDCCHLDCADPNQRVTHPELEPCGSDTNGGCNALADPNDPNSAVDPNAWENLGVLTSSAPTVVCGTLWADNGTRDTDWYKFTLPIQGTLTWETQSDIPLLSTPIFANGTLSPPTIAGQCHGGPLWGYFNEPRSYLCILGGIAAPDIFPGGPTYWWIAFPDSGSAIFYGFPCSDGWINYRITITHTPLTCDPCLPTDRQEGEAPCPTVSDTFNSGCDSTDGIFHVNDPNHPQLDPNFFYCGKSGVWADPNGNPLLDYDWWKIVLTGTSNKRLQFQIRAAFNLQYELYSVPGDVCANKVRLDYYEFGACESNVTITTTCLAANGAVYYVRFLPLSNPDCTQFNTYRFLYSILSEAPACTLCSVTCSTNLDNPCQADPNGAETNMGCNGSDPNAYMAFVAGNNTFGTKYCGRISTFTGASGASVDLDWFKYTQLAGRAKLVIRAKAMFRFSVNIGTTCTDPNSITHGWDRPCKGTSTSATQIYQPLVPNTQYVGVIIYGNGGGDGSGEQPLKQFFFGLPCSDNRNTYEIELQSQT